MGATRLKIGGMANRNRGKGLHKTAPRRAQCPECWRKGLSIWRVLPAVSPVVWERTCRYCGWRQTTSRAEVVAA